MSELASKDPITSKLPMEPTKSVPSSAPTLRLWPGVVIMILAQLLIWTPTLVAPGTMTQFMALFWGPVIGTVALGIWWLFFSRLFWSEKLQVLFGFLAIVAGAVFLAHGSMGMALMMYALPIVMAVGILYLVFSRGMSWTPRKIGLLMVFLILGGSVQLLRMDGIDGNFNPEFAYRFALTAEQKFLAENKGNEPTQPFPGVDDKPLELMAGDWPGFRGANRDSVVTGVRINTDWSTPPKQLWKKRIGPGWSSFAVVGDNLYTQEQRGDVEVVVCYHAETGKEKWIHEDKTRFNETVSGAGPRATPTFHQGKLYALGANGALTCLDARTGRQIWQADIVKDTNAKVPVWGFSASPLVVDGVVSVYAEGPDGKSVVAYDADKGKLAWTAGEGKASYCSMHPAKIYGVEQLLIITGDGVTSFEPKTGHILWSHDCPMNEKGMARVVQPAFLNDHEFLLGSGFNNGTRRIKISKKEKSWSSEEVWNTKAINPYFNDLVIHKNHLYGFDGAFFTCVNLDEGEKCWRARGYNNGQVLLLPEQDMLVIISEQGAVSLVEATPDGHKVKGKFQAIEGKTWNHPVIAHGKLFVRNGEEIACFSVAEKTVANSK